MLRRDVRQKIAAIFHRENNMDWTNEALYPVGVPGISRMKLWVKFSPWGNWKIRGCASLHVYANIFKEKSSIPSRTKGSRLPCGSSLRIAHATQK
jgi:hypothetical protein